MFVYWAIGETHVGEEMITVLLLDVTGEQFVWTLSAERY